MYKIDEIQNQVLLGDSLNILRELPCESVDSIVSSPPYWSLRKYGDDDKELGQEKTFQEYVINLVRVFAEAKRVLKKGGTCWINLADTYISKGATRHFGYGDPKNKKVGVKNYVEVSGLPQTIKEKSLGNIPHRFAIAMSDDGWVQRNTIVWYKRNAMPSSAKDRFTVDYEFIFFFVKSNKYYFKQQFEPLSQASIKDFNSRIKFRNKGSNNVYGCPGEGRDRREFYNLETGRNMRCVWDIPTIPSGVPHFAMYPETLVERLIEAGCPQGGIVLDPFAGAGNTLISAKKIGRQFIGIELYPKYTEIIYQRLKEMDKQRTLF